MAESVDAPDLKSVDRKGRGGSSPPTPISKSTFNSKKGGKKIPVKNSFKTFFEFLEGIQKISA